MSASTFETGLLRRLADGVAFLPDKPEETAESTLAALWWTAAGNPCSAEKAAGQGGRPSLTDSQAQALLGLVEKRIEGIPLAHLTGRQEFMGIEMLASPGALIPRKETEILGEACSGLIRDLRKEADSLVLLDVCTGSGNLALALASREEHCEVYGADISEEAVGLARENARFLGFEERVSFAVGDLIEPFRDRLAGAVDVLTCNPPYISSAKVPDMPDEISRFEPSAAFDGGPFGVRILMRLIREAPNLLRPGGWLAFELGAGQGSAIRSRIEKSSAFGALESYADPEGEIRALAAQRVAS